MLQPAKILKSAALVIAGLFLYAIFVEDSFELLVLFIVVLMVTGILLSWSGDGGHGSGHGSGGGTGYDRRSSGDDGFGDGDGGD